MAFQINVFGIFAHLSCLFSHCFRLIHFPAPWKEEKIINLPKPGKDRKFPSNLLRISLFSAMGKLLGVQPKKKRDMQRRADGTFLHDYCALPR
jgi:hypothetical protein